MQTIRIRASQHSWKRKAHHDDLVLRPACLRAVVVAVEVWVGAHIDAGEGVYNSQGGTLQRQNSIKQGPRSASQST